MKNLYAHAAIYPHSHPHPESWEAWDFLLSLLFFLLLVGLGYGIFKIFSRKEKTNPRFK